MTKDSPIDKLRVLLPHWIEHNRRHGDEFRAWVEELRKAGPAETAALLAGVIEKMSEIDAALAEVLEKLGGPGAGHGSHHHHHH